MPQANTVLDWSKLLSEKRKRSSTSSTASSNTESLIVRNAFEADYDRIVGSSSVRRLQDKAQVFPLQENDVARTRLTHSIEVSALARSLGKAVGKQLESQNIFSAEQTDQLASLLQVAGLIHDLGNPPFGHYGETVIRNWFTDWFKARPVLSSAKNVLTQQQLNDFLYFDGNVQNLRIVTKLQTQNDIYGANFTYATLGTIMKYPWASDQIPKGEKKFGYFASEESLVCDIRQTLGLGKNVRHPATYLLEAADDIIYLCDDIEDGVKKGYINWDAEFQRLEQDLAQKFEEEENDLKDSKNSVQLYKKVVRVRKLVRDVHKKDSLINPYMEPDEQQIARSRNFRNLVQGFLFREAISSFIHNYDRIMRNQYLPKFELLGDQKELTEALQGITARNCFGCREVLSLELSGESVINGLLDRFVPALVNSSGRTLADTRTYPGKLFQLISHNFVFIALHGQEESVPENTATACKEIVTKKKLADELDSLSLYTRLQLVTDFVAGMTDSYAFNLYQELAGIKHP